MAKLVFLVLLMAGLSLQAKTLKLELYAQTEISKKFKTSPNPVGGISGIAWTGSKLIAVSDDRGKFGRPRFYEMDLVISPKKAELSVSKENFFADIVKGWVLDLEALAVLPNGDFLVSTEGDNNKKPRAMPHILATLSNGSYKYDIPLPEKFLPEPMGQQKKGIENNRGFEGLTSKPDGQKFYAMNEYPIIADQGDDDLNYWLRLVEFDKIKDKENYKAGAELPYRVTRQPKNSKGPEVFRGVSEILFVDDSGVLVLERGARLTKTGLAYTAGLYLADLPNAKDLSATKNLSKAAILALNKTLLVDFEETFKNQNLENFEALAWGPSLPDGRKSLLVMSDDNFASKEKTVLLVFAVKEVP